MSPQNIVLTGIPRSGTTLCCSLLGQAANTVALFEPMPVHELPQQPDMAVAAIREFFSTSRSSLLATGTARSQQVDGQVPDNPFGSMVDANGIRVRTAHLGDIRVEKALSPDFTLVIKHNAAFTALLPDLVSVFACYAVVRNPLAVLASWNSVDLPVARGRLPAGERFDQQLFQRLERTSDVLDRQLMLLDWLFGRFQQWLPEERIVRYEQVVTSAGSALAGAIGLPVPALPMRSRNASSLYDAQAVHRYAKRLRLHDGCWRQFYGDDEVMQTLDALRERT